MEGRYRGDGYYEYPRGRFDASLVYGNEEVARTSGDVVIGYDACHRTEIEKWADEYGFNVEWSKSA